jgi:hypothetical protein
VATLPYWSRAVTIVLNGAPAVWLPGFATVKELAEPAPTVKLFDTPVIEPWVAVRVVVSALTRVMPAAVPAPEVKVTVDG